MSRSFKRYPGFRSNSQFGKRQASKAVRRNKNVGNGGSFKKCYCRYDIYDWNWRYYSLRECKEVCSDSFYTDWWMAYYK